MGRRSAKTFAYDLQIHRHVGFADLLSAALDDDEIDAQRSATAIIGWLSRYSHNRDGADCFSCGDKLVRLPAAILVLMPVRGADRQAIAGGLCADCCALPGPVLLHNVMATVKRVMPSAQLHCVPVAGGHPPRPNSRSSACASSDLHQRCLDRAGGPRDAVPGPDAAP